MMRTHRFLTLLLPALLAGFLCSCRLREQMDQVDKTLEDIQFQQPSDRERMLAGDTLLPPPREIRQQRDQESRQHKKETAEESTLKLLAELCRRQDEYEQVQVLLRDELARQQKERQAVAQAPSPEVDKRFADLEQRLQNIEQQIAALGQMINTLGQRSQTPAPPVTEPDDEQPSKPVGPQPVLPPDVPKKPQLSVKDPTAPGLPEPAIFKLPKTVVLAEEKTQPGLHPTVPSRITRPQRTFTPEAQALRLKARRAFQWIVNEYPNTEELIDARLNLAQMALEDGNVEEALKQFESLVAERPEDPRVMEAYLEAGKLRSELGEYAAARRHLYACADHAPESNLAPLALLEAAKTFDYEAAYGQALNGYTDVQHRFENTVAGRDAHRLRADLLLKLGRQAEARKLFAEIGFDKDPSNLDRTYAYLQTARSFLAEKRYADARNVLREFMMEHLSDEDGGETLRLFAQCNMALGESLDAARALARIPEKYPTYSKVLEVQEQAGEEFLALELASAAAEQFQKVLKALETATTVERADMEPAVLLGLTRALRMGGKSEDALATLRQLRTQFPTHPLAQAADLEQAELMVAEKRYGDAAELLGSSAQAYPGSTLSSRALIRKAELEERVVSPEQAVETYLKLKAAELEPAAAATCAFRRAVCLIHLNREAEALQVLKELVSSEQTPPALVSLARFQIGLALERQGKLGDALAAYLDFTDKTGPAAENSPELQELIKTARWKAEKLEWLRGLDATVSQADARTRKP